MNKRAYEQIKISVVSNEKKGGSSSVTILEDILNYLQRLQKYTDLCIIKEESNSEFGKNNTPSNLGLSIKSMNLAPNSLKDSNSPSHSKFQKYINMMTIMTNCLTSKGICRAIL